MPSKKIRIALSLPDDVDAVLKRLSKATNTPKTAIITELLLDTLPVFQEVLKAIEEVKQGQKEAAIQTMSDFLDKASGLLNQTSIDFEETKGKIRGGK